MKLFHGTPCGNFKITGPVLRGHRMCISFSWGASHSRTWQYLHRVKPCALRWIDNSSEVLLDCGAYSTWITGRRFRYDDVVDWYRRCIAQAGPTKVRLLIPDVIMGSDPDDLNSYAVPVWHTTEPIARAVRLSRRFQLVAVGACGPHRAVNRPAFFERMCELFNALPHQHFHLLRGLQMAGGPLPFKSGDSTDLGQNKSSTAERVRYYVDQWDRRAAQTAKVWNFIPPERFSSWDHIRQTTLF